MYLDRHWLWTLGAPPRQRWHENQQHTHRRHHLNGGSNKKCKTQNCMAWISWKLQLSCMYSTCLLFLQINVWIKVSCCCRCIEPIQHIYMEEWEDSGKTHNQSKSSVCMHENCVLLSNKFSNLIRMLPCWGQKKVLHVHLPGGGLQQVVGGHGHELNLLEDHLLPLLLLVERWGPGPWGAWCGCGILECWWWNAGGPQLYVLLTLFGCLKLAPAFLAPIEK